MRMTTNVSPTKLPAWQQLAAIEDTSASMDLSLRMGELLVDFSRQCITEEALQQLLALADQSGLKSAIADQLSGVHINESEDRAVLHSALRAPHDHRPAKVADTIEHESERLASFVASVRSNQWRGYTGRAIDTVVHIGIGGSHLGPELAYRALSSPTDALHVRFLANLDGQSARDALHGINPETTLFIVVSKSFSTLETKMNAATARSWFIERTGDLNAIPKHFVAVTSNLEAAAEFGMPEDNLFAMWDWVGGRYSLWSAVGLPLMLALGEAEFAELLAGAHDLDQHLATADFDQNLPVLMALIGIYNYNFRNVESLAVLPYEQRLRLLPDFLQQLETESNGKSIDKNGDPVTCQTMPVLWGGEESIGQHSFHQLLHQGNRPFTADFIGTCVPDHELPDHHNWQLANMLAQAEAMQFGEDADDPQRRVVGKRPTTTIMLDALTPRALGTLLALYEQKVFCQGVIWNINSFDQWGVELGKKLAERIYPALATDQSLGPNEQSKVSQELINHIKYSG